MEKCGCLLRVGSRRRSSHPAKFTTVVPIVKGRLINTGIHFIRPSYLSRTELRKSLPKTLSKLKYFSHSPANSQSILVPVRLIILVSHERSRFIQPSSDL